MENRAISHSVAVAAFDDCFYIACDFMKIAFEHVPREANVIAMN
jgi:hypothetical protein